MIYSADSLLQTIPQQELGRVVKASPKLDYGLARACMPHCIAVAKELLTGERTDVFTLNRFVEQYGAQTVGPGESSAYYVEGRGWNTPALAEDLRVEGHEVVLQNFIYGQEQADIPEMITRRRLSNIGEVKRYLDLAEYGGEDRNGWIEAIRRTIGHEGAVIVTVSIPQLDGSGDGGHGVLVHDISDGYVRYFDSDGDAINRYIDRGMPLPGIEHEVGRSTRYYRQPTERFVERMTGEAMHIYRKP